MFTTQLKQGFTGGCAAMLLMGTVAHAQLCSDRGHPGERTVASTSLSYTNTGALSAPSFSALTAISQNSIGQNLIVNLEQPDGGRVGYNVIPGASQPESWIPKLDLSKRPDTVIFKERVPPQTPLAIIPSLPLQTTELALIENIPPTDPLDRFGNGGGNKGHTMGPVDVKPVKIPTPYAIPPGPIPPSFGSPPIQPSPLGPIDVLEIQEAILADAIVLISFSITDTLDSKSQELGVCNGTNLGDGRILTNAHCFPKGATDYVVWFGEIDWPEVKGRPPNRSTLACQGERVASFAPKVPGRAGNETLDLALFQIPVGQMSRFFPHYLSSVVRLPEADVWCPTGQPCKDPAKTTLPDQKISVAQIWIALKNNPIVKNIKDYKRGKKTLSDSAKFAQADYLPLRQHCTASNYKNTAISAESNRVACHVVDGSDNFSSVISPYGFVHNCDTIPGSSGAPVFLKSDLDTFTAISGTRPRDQRTIALSGVHRAGTRDMANCLVPASLATPHINP